MVNKIWLLALCMYTHVGFLFAQHDSIVSVDGSGILLNVSKNIYFLVDEKGDLGINDILRPQYQKEFKRNDRQIFYHAPSPKIYWLKFTIQNKTNKEICLQSGSARTWYIDYYQLVDNEYKLTLETGSCRPEKNKRYPVNLFWFPLAQDSTIQVVYLKIYGEDITSFAFSVGTVVQLMENKSKSDYLIGSFIGILSVMFFYNLFLLFTTKDSMYAWYVAYLFPTMVNTAHIHHYPILNYLFPSLNIILEEYYVSWAWLSFALMVLFAVNYLDIPTKNRWLYIVLLVFCIPIVVIIPICNIFHLVPYHQLISLFVFSIQFISVVLMGTGIYFWLFKKDLDSNKKGRFFTIGWFCLILSVTVIFLVFNGVLPSNFYTRNSMIFGYILEVTLFSIALGDRITTLRKEKESSQAQNLKIIAEHNKDLEEKVTIRTQELKSSQEEVLVQNEELRQAQEELQTQRDFLDIQNLKLDAQNQKIRSSIRSAEIIQQAILPHQSKLDNLLKDYFIIYRPKDVVSGDFYWLKSINNKLILVVGDCTGHGVPGAFMTLIGYNLLDKIVGLWKITDPAEILNNLHIEIKDVLKQKYTQNIDGMDAVAICLDYQNPESIDILFSGAKNSLFYVVSGSSEIKQLKGSRKAIGGIQNEKIKFESQKISLAKDSIIYLGSDGLNDQNNIQRKKFGRDRIHTALSDNASSSMNLQKKALEEALDIHMQGTEQRDDILWMGVRL